MKKTIKYLFIISAICVYCVGIYKLALHNERLRQPTAEDCLSLATAGAHEWEYLKCMERVR